MNDDLTEEQYFAVAVWNFLETHSISELLQIVSDTIEAMDNSK